MTDKEKLDQMQGMIDYIETQFTYINTNQVSVSEGHSEFIAECTHLMCTS